MTPMQTARRIAAAASLVLAVTSAAHAWQQPRGLQPPSPESLGGQPGTAQITPPFYTFKAGDVVTYEVKVRQRIDEKTSKDLDDLTVTMEFVEPPRERRFRGFLTVTGTLAPDSILRLKPEEIGKRYQFDTFDSFKGFKVFEEMEPLVLGQDNRTDVIYFLRQITPPVAQAGTTWIQKGPDPGHFFWAPVEEIVGFEFQQTKDPSGKLAKSDLAFRLMTQSGKEFKAAFAHRISFDGPNGEHTGTVTEVSTLDENDGSVTNYTITTRAKGLPTRKADASAQATPAAGS